MKPVSIGAPNSAHATRVLLRGLLALALCACGSSPAQTATPGKHVANVAPLPAARATPPSGPLARVTVGPDHWVDISTTGPDTGAQAMCELLVADELRVATPTVKAVLARACLREPLPPAPLVTPFGRVLVETRHVEDADLVMASALAQEPPPSFDGVTGLVVARSRFPDAAACERVLASLAQARRQADADSAAAVRDFIAKELAEATRQREEACGRVVQRPCSTETGNTREICELTAMHDARACNDARIRYEIVRQHVDAPPPARPRATPGCQAP